MIGGFIGWLDGVGHRLRLPAWMQCRLCERFDRRLGVTEDEMRRT